MSPADNPDLVYGSDGRYRCAWGASPPIYLAYHDHEWGRPVRDERTLFEKVCLEGFQAGLSWLTVLRKRPAFREVFHDFDPSAVARMGAADIERLLADERIIRHRGKIEATINNARRLLELHETNTTLADVFWAYAPSEASVPVTMADIPSVTEDSVRLSRQLKGAGFRFVGPTTCYAALQAMGVVDDHLKDCHVRAAAT